MPADERREIEAAMDRLLDGTPLRSDGKLTIVSLAAEAGVKRHVLTHKHTDLKDLFNARVKAQHSVPASETALREQNAELCRKLDDMRAAGYGTRAAAESGATRYERSAVRLGHSRSSCSVDGQIFPEVDSGVAAKLGRLRRTGLRSAAEVYVDRVCCVRTRPAPARRRSKLTAAIVLPHGHSKRG